MSTVRTVPDSNKPDLDLTPEPLASTEMPGLSSLLQAIFTPAQEPAETERAESAFASAFIAESISILQQVDTVEVERLATGLARVRAAGGRLFVLGVGGSAAHASHAVNDFRKICGFEAYAPTDNVSELTARANDEGWDTCFAAWLRGSRISSKDAVLVFSVGGGDAEKKVSVDIVRALDTAVEAGAHVFGIVGRHGGYTKQVANTCVVIPPVVNERITPHTEGLCAVLWHLLVSHPVLQRRPAKWESMR
jgi:D-sedoheptulose 7-phosphate isomerase